MHGRTGFWLWSVLSGVLAAQPGNAAPAASASGQPAYRDITVTTSEGTWMSLDVSPDGKTIAFDLLNDIYIIPAGGGAARVIHSGPATQRSPQFSPDGTKLLYLSDETGADNVWVSAIDGANPQQVSRETLAMIAGPAWAPDGRSIVATKTNATVFDMRTSEIHRFFLDGAQEQRLVEHPKSGKDLQESRFSPDGKYLYYTERRGGDHYVYVNTGLGNFLIRRRDLGSGESVDLIAGFGSATTPQVSPDGQSIAFIRRVQARTVLFSYDIATGTQHPIYQELDRDLQGDYIPQEHYYPSFDWFPDNRHVAIWGKGQLLKIDMQAGSAERIPFQVTAHHRLNNALRTRLDAAPAQVDVKIVRQLAVAPRGDEILFRAIGKLWRQDYAGRRAPQRLTASAVAESDPAYSADGRRLAYVAWDDEKGSALKLRDMRGGHETVVATSRGMIRQPVFSRHGTRIAYRIMEPDASLGGAADPVGLYVVGADGKGARFLAAASGVAQFSLDDKRVYFFGVPEYEARKAVILRSIGVEGGEVHDHAHAETADTGDFTLSPDFKWLAFKEFNQLYVMPYREGDASVAITAVGNAAARKLTDTGAFDPAWSADSTRLLWTLGHDLYATAPGHGGIVAKPSRAVTLIAKTDVPDGVIAFVNARVLPMTGNDTIIERAAVVVERNRIKAVGAMGSVAIPAGAKVIDLAGKTLMPGMFDAHGHIDCCYGAGALPVKQPTRYAALAYGVTTNFDPYSNELISYESAEMTLAGETVGPRWLSSGHVIYGRSAKADRVFDPIASLEDARNIVRRKRALGGPILKSYKLPTRAQKQQLVQAAREGGLMVDMEGAGHFYDNVASILDGHTNLEHNLPVATYYDDLLQLFRHSDMSNTPTLIVTFGELFGENYIYEHQQPWKEAKVRTYIPGVNNAYNPISGAIEAPLYVRGMQSIHYADELYDIGFRSVGRSVKRLDDAGVTINVGSHGQASGIAMHWEMQLLAEGGMSPMRILRAATINGARTWGLDHQLGSIEPGKLADLIVLDRDPLADIHNTNSVRYTMVNGRLYDSNSMDEIGNRPRPRTKFFWEMSEWHGIDWNPAWTGPGS